MNIDFHTHGREAVDTTFSLGSYGTRLAGLIYGRHCEVHVLRGKFIKGETLYRRSCQKSVTTVDIISEQIEFLRITAGRIESHIVDKGLCRSARGIRTTTDCEATSTFRNNKSILGPVAR